MGALLEHTDWLLFMVNVLLAFSVICQLRHFLLESTMLRILYILPLLLCGYLFNLLAGLVTFTPLRKSLLTLRSLLQLPANCSRRFLVDPSWRNDKNVGQAAFASAASRSSKIY